jgi:hypothetical protein
VAVIRDVSVLTFTTTSTRVNELDAKHMREVVAAPQQPSRRGIKPAHTPLGEF